MVSAYFFIYAALGTHARITTRDGKQIGIESERMKFTERRTVQSREKGLLLVEIRCFEGKKELGKPSHYLRASLAPVNAAAQLDAADSTAALQKLLQTVGQKQGVKLRSDLGVGRYRRGNGNSGGI